MSLDQKRIEEQEENSETHSDTNPAISHYNAHTTDDGKRSRSYENDEIDLKSLKDRILDRNYTHIFDKAKEAAKGHSLLSPFGPKLGQQCRASHYDLKTQSSHNQLKEQYQESLKRQRELKNRIQSTLAGEFTVNDGLSDDDYSEMD